MRGLGISLAVLAFAVGAGSVSAQVTYDGCVDFRGAPVASVLNSSIPDVAIATLDNGAPVILYNPNVLARLKPETRLFFYMHECGHHTLGHALRGNPLTKEQEADCWGVRELQRLGKADAATVEAIQSDLVFSPGDWTHLPGPQRAFNLPACLGSGRGEDGTGPVAGRGQRCELEFQNWDSSSGGSANFTVHIDGQRKGDLDNGGDDDTLDLGILAAGAHRFRLSGIELWSPNVDLINEGGWCEGSFEVRAGQEDYQLTLRAWPGRYACKIE